MDDRDRDLLKKMLTIRTAGLDELDCIRESWTSLKKMHDRLDRLTGKEPSRKSWAERRLELLNKADTSSLFEVVAHDDGRVAGYCFSTVDFQGVGEIDSLYISRTLRGLGHGSDLVRNALSWFEHHECGEIRLWVHPANVEAVRFYWRFGFFTHPEMVRLSNRSPVPKVQPA